MKLSGFNMPSVFSSIAARLSAPPRVSSVEARTVHAAANSPNVRFYNPDELQFPESMNPSIPGAGGYVTQGLGMVVYDGQPTFNRNANPGPVREFFRAMREDNRIRSQ